MKIPERFVGFVEIDNEKIPFEFDKIDFKLNLYLPVEENRFKEIFSGFSIYESNLKEHKWIEKIQIEGTTSEGHKVYFSTIDNPSNYNGYRTYEIEWFYLTDQETVAIDELRFMGREIDFFYSPARNFQNSIKYEQENTRKIESMSVETIKTEDMCGGKYNSGDIEVEVACASYATLHYYSDKPFESESALKMKFSRAINLAEIVDSAFDGLSFIKYVSYRSNTAVKEIRSYITNDEGLKMNCGFLCLKPRADEETHKKANERIISAENLGEHIADIFNAIHKNEFAFGHLCESIKGTNSYPISRFIMILSAFEREFRNVYGQDARRSDDYKTIKGEVADSIRSLANNYSGRKRKYVNDFAKGIENLDSSYGDNLRYAFANCQEIMEPFISRRYEGTYSDIINDISDSINGLRNGVAHSRLDLEIEPRHITDIQFVEEMLYVIRLKKVGVEKIEIQKSINKLFAENMAI